MREYRTIPILLMSGYGFVKTTKFKNPIYLGDSMNILKIFNNKEVDELVIFDIEASKTNSAPNFDRIKEIVSECFMPISYGGGIRDSFDAVRIIQSGVEKIIVNTITEDYSKLNEISKIIGSSSTVACIDYKRNFFNKKTCYISSKNRKVKLSILDHVLKLQDSGVGEIILQSIDNEGTFEGYDLEILLELKDKIEIPIIISGGARDYNDFIKAIENGASAVSAGSLFVFQGNERGILVNYPSREELILNFYKKIK